MIPSSGITTTIVANELGVGTRNVSELCTSNNINMWAKYKPVRYATSEGITDAQRSSVNYGIGSVPYFTNINAMWQFLRYNDLNPDNNCSAPYFVYDKPRGGSSEPYRLGDFRLYNHTAVQPYSPYSGGSIMIGESNSFTIYMYANTSSQSHTLLLSDMNFINYSSGAIMKDWYNSYLCMALLSTTGTHAYYAVGNAKLTGDPTIGRYPGVNVFAFENENFAPGYYDCYLFVANRKDFNTSTQPTGYFTPLLFTKGTIRLKPYAEPYTLTQVAGMKVTSGRVLTANCVVTNNTESGVDATIKMQFTDRYDNIKYTDTVTTYISAESSYTYSKGWPNLSVYDSSEKVIFTVTIADKTLKGEATLGTM